VSADPQHIRHDDGGTRPVPVPADAAQAHARIVEALHDPFAFAVALLGSEAVRRPSPQPEEPRPVPSAPRPRKPARRTAADILKPRAAMGAVMGPLSGRSSR
jgi:hypothetical protein